MKDVDARAAALLAVLVATLASAQPAGLPTVELERLVLNPSGQGSLLVGTGELLLRRDLRLSLTGHYEKDPLVVSVGGREAGAVVSRRVTGHLSGAVGLTDWLELSAQVPVLLSQGGDELSALGLGRPAEGVALGTPLLTARLALLSARTGDALDLALGVTAGFPVGSAASLAREDSLRVAPSLMAGKRFGPLRAALEAGVLLRSETRFSEAANVIGALGNEARLGAVLSTTGSGLRAELDVLSHVPLDGAAHSIEAMAGLRLPFSDQFEAYVLGGVGFDAAPGTPRFRGLVGFAYATASSPCDPGRPHEPSQCPRRDDDRDGILNAVDRCPLAGGRIDATGCPLSDGDQDGVLDGVDRCPAQAGATGAAGCPDADWDGVEDAADACPRVYGPESSRGCPDSEPARADGDGDGVQDDADNCPAVAGAPDNRGCPSARKQRVTLGAGALQVQDPIVFLPRRSVLTQPSLAVVDQVAEVLLAHPELPPVTLQAALDERGSKFLAKRRAKAVRDRLLKQGVPAARVLASDTPSPSGQVLFLFTPPAGARPQPASGRRLP